MTYLEIFNKLSVIEDMPMWHRIKMTFRIANCSPTIIGEICNYLETQEQPDYSLRLAFTDPITNMPKETVVTCQDIQDKMRLQPLPALLYMDWLRREPTQAASFVLRKDSMPQMPLAEIRAHIDPDLLAKADKAKKEHENSDLIMIEEEQ